MKTKSRGIALVTVLLVAFVVLGIVLAGLQLTSQNVLFVAGTHHRNAALSAAEGGIYRALAELEDNPSFSGKLQEDIGKSSFEVTVTNDLIGPGTATLRSTGHSGRFSRTVEVTVAFSGGSYHGVGAEGPISARGPTYSNGIRSLKNPVAEASLVHSNSGAEPAISSVDDEDLFSIRGTASAAGTVADSVDANAKEDYAGRKNLIYLEKAGLLRGSFVKGNMPANGLLSGNLRVPGGVEYHDKVSLQDGATLHVEGDAIFHKGVNGDGTVVTDGDLYVRGSSEIDTDAEGVVLYSDGDLFLVHPEATQEGEKDFVAPLDEVGDYFAQMPPDAPHFLSQGLPPDAPNGVDFFNWYDQQSNNPNSSFEAWRDGDGSDLNPGLPAEVREWLDTSRPINSQLNTWAGGS